MTELVQRLTRMWMHTKANCQSTHHEIRSPQDLGNTTPKLSLLLQWVCWLDTCPVVQRGVNNNGTTTYYSVQIVLKQVSTSFDNVLLDPQP